MGKARQDKDREVACPVCKRVFRKSFLPHLRAAHSEEWQRWRASFIAMLEGGASLQQIGRRYDISWTVVEREIKKMIEAGEQKLKHKAKPVKTWEPEDFDLERTTVWSFQKRGNWATHRGDFRGNWAPEIPRNIMTRYSKKGDLVLDQFVGSGTTVIEAKLLNKKGDKLVAIVRGKTFQIPISTLADEDQAFLKEWKP